MEKDCYFTASEKVFHGVKSIINYNLLVEKPKDLYVRISTTHT